MPYIKGFNRIAIIILKMQCCENNYITNNNLRGTKIVKFIKEKFESNQKFYGIEISTKFTEQLCFDNFKINPLFIAITWDNFSDSTLSLVRLLESKNEVCLMHLSCYKMTTERLKYIVEKTNISNVLVIRGDLVDEKQEFKYASDMVKKLKEIKNDISIGVCGYPDVHPEAKSFDADLQNLKIKVDSGADFIITQLCFSTYRICNFIKKCRDVGIKQPVIPGIFTPSSWLNLQKMLRITKVSIEKDLLEQFESYKGDDKKFKQFSILLFKNMINELVFNKESSSNGVHFFTLNSFDVAERIVNELF